MPHVGVVRLLGEWVDFEYEIDGQVYQYSLQGGDSIDLGELLVKIGIVKEADVDVFITLIEDVQFSNPDLLKVVHKKPILGIIGRGSWELKSLQSFDTEESLIVTMKDGRIFSVKVIDHQYFDDLYYFVDEVDINAPTEGSTYVVRPGATYDVTLKFKEGSSYQFSEDEDNLYYQMPDGVKALDSSNGTIDITYIDENQEECVVRGNTVTVENGKLILHWNTEDPNYEGIGAANNLAFNINVKVEFDENAGKIKFGDSVTKDVIVDTSKGVTVAKTGSYDANPGKIWYEVKVTSTGSTRSGMPRGLH